MNNNYNTRLELSPTEKKKLRSCKIQLKAIDSCSVEQLQSALQTSKIRAMEVKALYEFRSLPSIGSRFSHDLVSMGYYSLDELKGKDPVKLFHQYETMIGAWADPCLEDQFRLVVHYANHKSSTKNWWDFTAERKAFREKNGYPDDRPTKPWYELEQYKKENQLDAKAPETKKEIVERLKKSIAFIKRNYTEKITLAQLSKMALLSPFHFQRSFTLVYEQSPLEFITHLRLKKACRLLRETKKPVDTIALQCGFENTSSFIRLFKQRFRKTPGTYRKRSETIPIT